MRSVSLFTLGVMVGRTFGGPPSPSRQATGEAQPDIVQGASPVPVSLFVGAAGAVNGADDLVSVARAYAMRVARIAADASAALSSAQAKVHAGIVANPRDNSLVDESDRLQDAAGALLEQFLTLYAKQLAEEALGVIAGSTEELQARAAEMPAATKSVGEIRPVVAAAVNVGTAITEA